MVDVERHWPWVVLVAAVIANVLSGGVIRSYGLIYMDFRDRLETSSIDTVIIAALAYSLSGLIAPLAEGLARKLNCFLVTLFGAVIMCLGLLISAFFNTVYLHYITLGFFVGCGCGFVHIASILAVSDTFTETPILMFALLSAALPFGTFLFGFITRGLIDRFAYFGTFLVLSAIMANCIVCGLIFRPYRVKRKPSFKSKTYERMTSPVDDEFKRGEDNSVSTSEDGDGELRETADPEEEETTRIHKDGLRRYQSIHGPTEEIVISTDSDVIQFSDYVVDDEVYVSSEDEEVTKPSDVRVVEEPRVEETPPVETSTNEEPETVVETKEETPPTFIGSISDPRSLCNSTFIILLVAILLYSMGFGVPLVYFPDLAREHDISDFRAVWPITVLGLLSAFTVIVSDFSLQNFITKYPRTIIVLIAGSTIVGGVIIALAHYYDTYELLLMGALMFGMFSAPCRALGTSYLIIRETTVVEDIIPIFVWGNLVSGVGFLAGLPISAALHDVGSTYSWSFVFAGLCITLSALVSLLLTCRTRAHVRLID